MPAKKKLNTISEDSYQRLAADFANYQRRSEEEKAQLIDFVTSGLIEQLLPVVDNFHRAAVHAPTMATEGTVAELTEDDFKKIRSYLTGLQGIEKQLSEVLQGLGLSKIATYGEPFNANLHEAISYEQSADIPADHIIGEVESGFTLNGKVIRPAKVRVSKGQ